MLNLLATGRELDLIAALDWTLLITEYNHSETLYLDSRPGADGLRQRTPASTEGLVKANRLIVRSLDDTWLESFVRAAEYLPDPDASCVALAGTLNVPLFSDDPRVRKVASDIFPAVALVSTLEFLHAASQALALSQDELRELAQSLRWRGNFLPPRVDKHREWYAGLLQSTKPEAP